MASRLVVGLEVHAQLRSAQKLFSRTPVAFHSLPNSLVSYFDAALPGTQPILSWDSLNLALRAGIALDSKISPYISFDRKHYMYPDQPAGYQITQQYEPLARKGFLELNPRDFPKKPPRSSRKIRIKQIQLEQDTGKTTYVEENSLVDLNRANMALIEIVTEPDFTSAEECVIFIRKLQLLLRRIGVSTGEMETGAMRVDVNVSIGSGPRCEIKNLFSTSAVHRAVIAEYKRQLADMKAGKAIEQETRGWDGSHTWKLRGKESKLDYRYMPDPEIPIIGLSARLVENTRRIMPQTPESLFDKLLAENVPLVDSRTLLYHPNMRLVNFYFDALSEFKARSGANSDLVAKWLVHRWPSELGPPSLPHFVDLLLEIDRDNITTTSGKLVLKHLAELAKEGIPPDPISTIIKEYNLEKTEQPTQELEEICSEIVSSNPDVVERIKNGKKGSLSFLLGQVMKETQGTCKPPAVLEILERLIKS